jgi:phosphohistidine phosphatase SixA
VAVVGHEPDLSRLIGLLTAGRIGPCVALKKGGVALVTFEGRVSAGAGCLAWMLTPAILKKLS